MANNDINSNREPRARVMWAAPVAVLLTFVLVGCYTILQHPITEGDNQQQAYHQEYYREQCIDCHADYAEFPYGFFYGDYPTYYFDNPRWGHYYAYPWWWDHYWYDSDGPVTDEDRQGGEPSRKAGRRGSLAPPYVGGSPAMPTGGGTYSAPGGARSKGGSSSGDEPAQPRTPGEKIRVNKSASSDEDNSNDDSNKKKKAGRRGGIDP
ncbi:MAG: hypothetical protein GF341_02815 [candidate division Zixibacteria bacterium]|nr:hypothetical protein [candidate division Zixibacteria bacterium]